MSEVESKEISRYSFGCSELRGLSPIKKAVLVVSSKTATLEEAQATYGVKISAISRARKAQREGRDIGKNGRPGPSLQHRARDCLTVWDQTKKAKVSQLSALQATIKQMRGGMKRKEETKNSPQPLQEEQEEEEMKENRRTSSSSSFTSSSSIAIARLREACALPRSSFTSSSSSARKASERAVLATPPRSTPPPPAATVLTAARAKRNALVQKNAKEAPQNKMEQQQEEKKQEEEEEGRLEGKEVVKEEERRVAEVEVEVEAKMVKEVAVAVVQEEEVSLLDDGYRHSTSEEVEVAMATGWREFSSVEAFEEQQRQMEQEQEQVPVEAVGGYKESVEEEEVQEEEEEVVTYFEEGAALMVSVFRAVLTALVDGGGGAGGGGVIAFLPESVAAVVRAWITPLAALGGVAEVLLSFFLLALEVVAEGVRFLWSRFRVYQPGLLAVTGGGLATAFWGAHFPLTLAALEALLLANCLGTLRHLRHLFDALHAHYLSHSRATSSSSSASTTSSSSSSSASTTSLLLGVMKAVDPQTVAGALAGLNAALLAVVTTLRLRFAQTIALGNAMAASLEEPLEVVAGPALRHLLGGDLEAWAPYLLSAAVRLVAVVLAWRMRRVLSAYHSALRGG